MGPTLYFTEQLFWQNSSNYKEISSISYPLSSYINHLWMIASPRVGRQLILFKPYSHIFKKYIIEQTFLFIYQTVL